MTSLKLPEELLLGKPQFGAVTENCPLAGDDLRDASLLPSPAWLLLLGRALPYDCL